MSIRHSYVSKPRHWKFISQFSLLLYICNNANIYCHKIRRPTRGSLIKGRAISLQRSLSLSVQILETQKLFEKLFASCVGFIGIQKNRSKVLHHQELSMKTQI